MDITKWFNIKMSNHLKAFEHLLDKGSWPKNFIPPGITFRTNWKRFIEKDIVDVYLKEHIKIQ